MKVPVLIIIIFTALKLNAQITVINTGTSDNLRYILSSNKNYLICGEKKFLAKTYNACNSLIPVNIPTFPNSNYSFRISRPDTNVLYMTASSFNNLNLTFWKSTNGGQSWSKRFDTICANMYGGTTFFFDSQNGISFTVNQNTIRTNNGFNTYSFGTWNGIYSRSGEVFGDSILIHGGCTVDCGFSISYDRGNTWPNNGLNTGICTPIDYKLLSKDTVFVITDVALWSSYFFRTFNGGTKWDFISFENPQMTTPDIAFAKLCVKNKNEIYIVGREHPYMGGYIGKGVILKSTDLGKNWSTCYTPFSAWLFDMKFINDSTALICGENGLLFKWNSKHGNFTAIPESKLKSQSTTIFPNPVSGSLNIKLPQSQTECSLIIFDALGNKIKSMRFDDSLNPLDFEPFRSGVYFLRFQFKDRVQTIKVIKNETN